MTRLIHTTWILILSLLLFGCGGSAGGAAGEWELDTADFKKKLEQSMAEQAEEAGVPAGQEEAMKPAVDNMAKSMACTMVLSSDGTCTMKGAAENSQMDESGKWSMEGDRVKLDWGGNDPGYGTIKGNRMTVDMTQKDEAGAGPKMPDLLFKRK